MDKWTIVIIAHFVAYLPNWVSQRIWSEWVKYFCIFCSRHKLSFPRDLDSLRLQRLVGERRLNHHLCLRMLESIRRYRKWTKLELFAFWTWNDHWLEDKFDHYVSDAELTHLAICKNRKRHSEYVRASAIMAKCSEIYNNPSWHHRNWATTANESNDRNS